MPARGDRTAPQFDPTKPRELRRFFDDLEYILNRAQITSENEMKRHATRYVDIDTSELWETLPEFTDHTKTFEEFKTALQDLYPGSKEERKWTVADMDQLIGERSRLGILSLADLGDYYRQFLAITTFLKGKSRLSNDEQSRAFARGFSADLWRTISQRLQLKAPDHHPDDPYTLEAIHEAALYVLHGTSSTLSTRPNTTTTATTPTTAAAPEVKTEDLAAILERLTDSFIKAMVAQNVTHNHAQPTGGGPRPPANPQAGCTFCGSLEHFIRSCDVVDEYMRQGKVRRNVDGKVVLSTGAFVPRDIVGRYLKDRVDEWHKRNPGQLAAAQLMYTVLSNEISEPQPTAKYTMATRETHPDLFDIGTNMLTPSSLSAQERIASLERELFALRQRQIGPASRTRAQKGKDVAASETNKDDKEADSERSDPPRPTKTVLRPEVVIPRTAPPPLPAPQSIEKPQTVVPAVNNEEPEHPFAKARDASYAVPQNRNYAGAFKPPVGKKPEPAYRTFPPVYDDKIATDVYDRAMSTEVTVTQRELLSLSPEVRSQVREAVSAKRNAANNAVKEIHTLAEDDALPFALDDIEPAEAPASPPVAMLMQSIQQPVVPPPGALIVPDPYETYLKSLPSGATPELLVVAKESSALRSIFPLVDNQQHIEGILDPGSQIIAMAEEVCLDLGLVYDPTVVLHMQSANGEVDPSLGLARNVPMRIGDITLYVQIHIIRSPAYDILLGRPFDVLTESVVRNFANEDQTITIFDPNTGRRATVPTSPRGRPRRVVQRPSFQASMN